MDTTTASPAGRGPAATTPARSGELAPSDLAPVGVPITAHPRDPLGFPGYLEKLDAAATGDVYESVTVGIAELDGLPNVVALGSFAFLGYRTYRRMQSRTR